MNEILNNLYHWLQDGEQAALAIVMQTWGSSPRVPGSKMAITASGKISGSVSGGCVEGAVIQEAQTVFENYQPKVVHYGVADETAWEVGLSCGGKIDVLIVRTTLFDLNKILEIIKKGETVYWRTILSPDNQFGIYNFTSNNYVSKKNHPKDSLINLMHSKNPSSSKEITLISKKHGEIKYFCDVIRPPQKLFIIGAGHISVVLAKLAKNAGFEVIIIDPRKTFSTKERFPEADRIIQSFPDRDMLVDEITSNTAIAILSHDPKIDDPGLFAALESDAFYIGALGSRKTQVKRKERMLAAGINPKQLERIRGPIGLDLGGRKPEEIALAILAEIVQVRNTL